MPLYQGIQLIIGRRERLAPAELRNDSLAPVGVLSDCF